LGTRLGSVLCIRTIRVRSIPLSPVSPRILSRCSIVLYVLPPALRTVSFPHSSAEFFATSQGCTEDQNQNVEVVNLHIMLICRQDFPVYISTNYCTLLFFHGFTAPVVQGLLIFEVPQSHSDTLHSVGPPGRVTGPSQRRLPDNARITHKRKTCKFMLLAHQT